ncbi:LysM peptidoglycan-binding domain-containing protein [Deinococcus maricopensis]|uniref:Peptidoglycan-binding lysin domain protein n=1 Tax=Deinococcus maricopensis (strain DSM 21211 / LMG 22137 / NRRL B-23946 / LB-34) TaxID=709986 RepID=E8U3D6_DEIML|nr:LysM peptidoglycan-binding domain-containing protein [Deinococcus maricopensis]ADV65807.1 Peptidoglycan-binding lysin domain protein [Deinococcus maricopensis DSM 21211]
MKKFRALLLTLAACTAQAATGGTYTVQVGDTLYSIARRHGLTPDTLMQANALSGTAIQLGQVLTLPGDPTPPPATTHTVQPGETLYSLARRYGVTVDSVLAENGLTSPNLNAGQLLRLPGGARDLGPVAPPASAAPVRGPVAYSGDKHVTHTNAQLLPLTTDTDGTRHVLLDGLAFQLQSRNNCGPSAIAAVLGYYGIRVNPEALGRELRPDGGYMAVQAIPATMRKYNLAASVVRGATLTDLKRLVSAGIPVIVLQWQDTPGKTPHFRTVRGFDDDAGQVLVNDSMYGPLVAISYRDFDTLWNTQGRQMIPVFPQALAATVTAMLD